MINLDKPIVEESEADKLVEGYLAEVNEARQEDSDSLFISS